MEVEGVEDVLEEIAPISTHVLLDGLKEVPVESVDDDTGSPLDEIGVAVASYQVGRRKRWMDRELVARLWKKSR